MSTARVLRVRCTTWEQVEAFYRRKLRRSGRLSMKVPFACELGTQVTLGLELPNQIVIAIDGTVSNVGATTAGRTAIDVSLFGLSADLLKRLEVMVGDARSVQAEEEGDDERRLLHMREADLRRKRLLATHEIVGVPRDPSAVELRAAWIALASREHPDTVARYASTTLSSVAEETMILASRAYGRLRAAVVADGRGVAVGATVRPPATWTPPDDPMATGFFAEAVTPPVEDTVELVDASLVHTLPSPEQLAALDRASVGKAMTRSAMAVTQIEAAAVDAAAVAATEAAAMVAAEEEAAAVARGTAAVDGDREPGKERGEPGTERGETGSGVPAGGEMATGTAVGTGPETAVDAPGPLPPIDDLLPPVVTMAVAGSAGVRWSGPADLFSDLDLGPASSGEAPIAVEESLAQARSGPGDRFVRQIRAKLGAGDHGGAREVAEAALHLYGGDRRLRGLYHVAAAMAACTRADRTSALSELETALAHDPACLEAATALEHLRRAGIPSAPAIQRLFT